MSEHKTVVDALYNEYKDVNEYLGKANEISFQISVQNNYKKNLLLAAASYFEHEITESLTTYCEEVSNPSLIILSFVKQKAIKRQYHTYFDWEDEKKGANKFFAMFGTE